MGEAPFPTFDVVLFGHNQFKQVADRSGNDKVVILVEVIFFGASADGFGDVVSDRGFLGDDEGFAHGLPV